MSATALHIAAEWDKGAAAAQLVAAGADVLCEDTRGRTALILGSARCCVSVVEVLAQHYPVSELIRALLAAAQNETGGRPQGVSESESVE